MAGSPRGRENSIYIIIYSIYLIYLGFFLRFIWDLFDSCWAGRQEPTFAHRPPLSLRDAAAVCNSFASSATSFDPCPKATLRLRGGTFFPPVRGQSEPACISYGGRRNLPYPILLWETFPGASLLGLGALA